MPLFGHIINVHQLEPLVDGDAVYESLLLFRGRPRVVDDTQLSERRIHSQSFAQILVCISNLIAFLCLKLELLQGGVCLEHLRDQDKIFRAGGHATNIVLLELFLLDLPDPILCSGEIKRPSSNFMVDTRTLDPDQDKAAWVHEGM